MSMVMVIMMMMIAMLHECVTMLYDLNVLGHVFIYFCFITVTDVTPIMLQGVIKHYLILSMQGCDYHT